MADQDDVDSGWDFEELSVAPIHSVVPGPAGAPPSESSSPLGPASDKAAAATAPPPTVAAPGVVERVRAADAEARTAGATRGITPVLPLKVPTGGRATPPARPAPLVTAQQASTALRLGTEGRGAIDRTRAPTLANPESLQMLLADTPRSGDPGRATLVDPNELDDLPVDEMIESARSVPRRALHVPSIPPPKRRSSSGLRVPASRGPESLAAMGPASEPSVSSSKNAPKLEPETARPIPSAAKTQPPPPGVVQAALVSEDAFVLDLVTAPPRAPQETREIELDVGDRLTVEMEAPESFGRLLSDEPPNVVAPLAVPAPTAHVEPPTLDLEPPREPEPEAPPIEDVLMVLQARMERGDVKGALLRADKLLEHHPDHPEVRQLLERCKKTLATDQKVELGGGRKVYAVGLSPSEIQKSQLDHRAGFVLSLVDGTSSVDEIIDMSGMSDFDATQLLIELVDLGILRSR